jgi:plasmid stability protein
MAPCIICWQNGSMAELTETSIQVRHVPADVHAVLRKRAASEGKSLQEYVLGLLVAQARRPTRHEVLARAGRRAGGHLSLEETNEILRADRDSH